MRTLHGGDASKRPSTTYRPHRVIGHYQVVLHENGTYYVAWYEPKRRQMRRKSLKTFSPSEAVEIVERLVREGVEGDPAEALAKDPIVTAGDAFDYYLIERGAFRSSQAARIAIAHLVPVIGNIRLGALRNRDFKRFAVEFQTRGYSLAYTSRVLSVARAAFNKCLADDEIAHAPKVPELRGKAEREAEPERGRPMSAEEIAWLIDCNVEAHMLAFLIAECHTGGRMEAILEASTSQIDWNANRIDLNPKGRVQTKKYRPILRLPQTWTPWLRTLPQGAPLVSYNGHPVASVKKAMQKLATKSELPGRVNATSIRHSIGRFFEEQRVPSEERSVFFGHVSVSRKPTTDRYSPTNAFHPEYLAAATAAVEAFVREINSHTRKWDLLTPFAVKPGWKGR